MTVPIARVLVVDDEPASVRALCDVRPQHGYQGHAAASGSQALAALEESPYDIVLTDLMMPGMDGVELITRALEIDGHIVGIIMTGAGTIETAVQAMKAGAIDYVLKPIRIHALLPALARAASIRRLRLENLELRNTVAIHELTQAMAHTRDPNVLLERIADAAAAQFEADQLSIMLLDEDATHLYVAAVRGEDRRGLLGKRIPLSHGIAGWVGAQREPLNLQGPVTDERFAPLVPRPEIQSALVMPMITRGKLVGVLNVACVRRRSAFSHGQIKVLSMFANAAASGIEAARLYDAQRRLDARYREVLEMAADAIISTDEEGRIVVFNAGAEAMFGYTQAEALGQPLEMLLPAEAVQPYLRSAQGEGGAQAPAAATGRRTLVARRKNGTPIDVEVAISGRSEHGATLCTAVVRDITDRMRQERRIASLTRIMTVLGRTNSAIVRIRERHALFQEACRIAVEDGGAGIAWIGTVDLARQLVTPVVTAGLAPDSPAALARTSFDPTNGAGPHFIGKAIREKTVAYCSDLAQLPDAGGPRRVEALRRGLRSVVVLPLLLRDVPVAVLVLYLPSLENTGAEGMDLYRQLAADISFGLEHIDNIEQLHAAKQALELERERLAERVAERTAALTESNRELARAREEADQANRAKSAFLATMSHEIRTPMNGVLGMLEVLAHEPLSEQQMDIVHTIRDSATVLLGLIDDILDFSKVEAGRIEIERSPMCLPDVIEAICASLLPVAWKAGVDLSLFVAPEAPAWVRSDEVRLRQVLFNLLGNAIKFSGGRPHKRGYVSLRVEVVSHAPLQLAFRVADNGIGMDESTLERIFKPFTQGEASTTRRFGGTGLGLAICQRLVALMGGEIHVQSRPDEGSTFEVVLPFEASASTGPAPTLELAGLKCLIVARPGLEADDLRRYLEHAGAHAAIVDEREATLAGAPSCELVVLREGSRGHGAGDDDVDAKSGSDSFDARSPGIARRRLRIEGTEVVMLERDALRRQVLVRAMARAAGRLAPEAARAASARRLVPTPPPSIAEARAQGRLILVVEDDAINQKVVLRQLALLGYAAEVASNGAEALRMWREGRYGLVLTDLNMPDLDGYSLAEAIRKEETGRQRVPIIALTANAVRGEANRAQVAGMDDYLTKPIELKALQQRIERWLAPSGSEEGAAIECVDSEPVAPTIFDRSVLGRLVGADAEVEEELLSEYLESAATHAGVLRAAHADADLGRIAAVAHKLKSSSRSVGALALGELCADLDAVAKAGDRVRIAELMTGFERIYRDTEEEIRAALAQSRSRACEP